MNPVLKPFRLINEHEIAQLQQRLNRALQAWNKEHALFTLSVELNREPPKPLFEKTYLFENEQRTPMVLLLTQNVSALSYSLFGDTSDCFNQSSENQLTTLFNHLLGIQTLQKHTVAENDITWGEDWFYRGAPSLMGTLSAANLSMTFCLSPQWVLQALSRPKEIPKPKSALEEALEPQLLHCQIALAPVLLALQDVLHLQVGDVLKTDHLLTEPLLLKHEQHLICQVEIGAQNHYKSIQIASSL